MPDRRPCTCSITGAVPRTTTDRRIVKFTAIRCYNLLALQKKAASTMVDIMT